MGAAAHTRGNQLGVLLGGIAVAAALYGAVVAFVFRPSSPLAVAEGSVPPSLVMHVRVHARAAPSQLARGPQPSPRPARLERL